MSKYTRMKLHEAQTQLDKSYLDYLRAMEAAQERKARAPGGFVMYLRPLSYLMVTAMQTHGRDTKLKADLLTKRRAKNFFETLECELMTFIDAFEDSKGGRGHG